MIYEGKREAFKFSLYTRDSVPTGQRNTRKDLLPPATGKVKGIRHVTQIWNHSLQDKNYINTSSAWSHVTEALTFQAPSTECVSKASPLRLQVEGNNDITRKLKQLMRDRSK